MKAINKNQISLNFETNPSKLREIQESVKVKPKIFDILDWKNIPNRFYLDILYKNYKIDNIEFFNWKIRKIFFIYKKQKYQLNITDYELDEMRNYSSNDEEIIYQVKKLKIPSFNENTSHNMEKEIYWRKIKNYEHQFYDVAEYIIENCSYMEDDLQQKKSA